MPRELKASDRKKEKQVRVKTLKLLEPPPSILETFTKIAKDDRKADLNKKANEYAAEQDPAKRKKMLNSILEQIDGNSKINSKLDSIIAALAKNGDMKGVKDVVAITAAKKQKKNLEKIRDDLSTMINNQKVLRANLVKNNKITLKEKTMMDSRLTALKTKHDSLVNQIKSLDGTLKETTSTIEYYEKMVRLFDERNKTPMKTIESTVFLTTKNSKKGTNPKTYASLLENAIDRNDRVDIQKITSYLRKSQISFNEKKINALRDLARLKVLRKTSAPTEKQNEELTKLRKSEKANKDMIDFEPYKEFVSSNGRFKFKAKTNEPYKELADKVDKHFAGKNFPDDEKSDFAYFSDNVPEPSKKISFAELKKITEKAKEFGESIISSEKDFDVKLENVRDKYNDPGVSDGDLNLQEKLIEENEEEVLDFVKGRIADVEKHKNKQKSTKEKKKEKKDEKKEQDSPSWLSDDLPAPISISEIPVDDDAKSKQIEQDLLDMNEINRKAEERDALLLNDGSGKYNKGQAIRRVFSAHNVSPKDQSVFLTGTGLFKKRACGKKFEKLDPNTKELIRRLHDYEKTYPHRKLTLKLLKQNGVI